MLPRHAVNQVQSIGTHYWFPPTHEYESEESGRDSGQIGAEEKKRNVTDCQNISHGHDITKNICSAGFDV